MLSLSRPHRQVLFTIGIVAATMVPTALVAVAAWTINRPGHLRDVEAELGLRLGLKVTLEGVRYPRPGMVVYEGAVLWQTEARRDDQLVRVAQVDRLEVREDGRRLVLRAEGLSLAAESPRRGMEQVGELLSRAGGESWDLVALSAETCGVDLGDGIAFELRDLAGSYREENGGPRIESSYRLVTPEKTPNRCELVLERDRSGDEPRTLLSLRTVEGLPLPARVLEPFFSTEDWLGPDARVQGDLQLARVGAGDWSASFSGELIDVALEALVGRRVPIHTLSGPARLVVDQAEWGPDPSGPGSKWRSVSGELTAGPGAISPGLLLAFQNEMHFRLANDDRFAVRQVSSDEPTMPFQGLGVRFEIQPDGVIQLDGALGDAYEPGAVLIEPDRFETILRAPSTPADLIGFRRTLGPIDPSDAILVPADPNQKFLDYLPDGGPAPLPEDLQAN